MLVTHPCKYLIASFDSNAFLLLEVLLQMYHAMVALVWNGCVVLLITDSSASMTLDHSFDDKFNHDQQFHDFSVG